MDKFSAYNRMNSKGRNFPLALDGNSVRRHLQAGAENFSASGEFFRPSYMCQICMQPFEIEVDYFSAAAKNKWEVPIRFAARNGTRRADVNLRQTSDFRAEAI